MEIKMSDRGLCREKLKLLYRKPFSHKQTNHQGSGKKKKGSCICAKYYFFNILSGLEAWYLLISTGSEGPMRFTAME